MLRAIRFAVRLGFELAPECAAGINSQAHRLAIVSGERIRDELTKMLMHKTAGDALRWMQRLGLLAVFAPELEAMVGVSQGGAHEWDVWEHTVRAVEALPGDASLVLRLAALLHDVAKPATRTVEEDGRLRFFDHQIVGLEMARGLLRRLRFASGEIAVVLRLIRTHMRPGAYSKEWSDGAVRRLMRDAGDRFDDLIALCKADAAAHRPDGKPPDFRELLAHVRKVESEFPAATATSPLDGNEIMEALGLEPGESVGRMKEALSEAVLDGRLEPGDKAAALRMLLKLWEAEG
jgi:poly(A) polymerase